MHNTKANWHRVITCLQYLASALAVILYIDTRTGIYAIIGTICIAAPIVGAWCIRSVILWINNRDDPRRRPRIRKRSAVEFNPDDLQKTESALVMYQSANRPFPTGQAGV